MANLDALAVLKKKPPVEGELPDLNMDAPEGNMDALSVIKSDPKKGAELLSQASGMEVKPKEVKKGAEGALKAVSNIKSSVEETGQPSEKDLKPLEKDDGDSKRKIFMALSATIPTLIGGIFGGSEGAAMGAKTTQNIYESLGKQEREDEKLQQERLAKLAEAKLKAGETVKDRAFQLNKEYQGDPVTKRTKDISDSYARLNKVAEKPSAASDIALIYSFMKLNDPGSTVREGEFATAQNAAGIPDRLRAQYNAVKSGERLSENQRADFIKQAQNLYAGQLESQSKTDQTYLGLGEKFGIGPDMFQTIGTSFNKKELAGAGGKTIQNVIMASQEHSLEDLEAEAARRRLKAR